MRLELRLNNEDTSYRCSTGAAMNTLCLLLRLLSRLIFIDHDTCPHRLCQCLLLLLSLLLLLPLEALDCIRALQVLLPHL